MRQCSATQNHSKCRRSESDPVPLNLHRLASDCGISQPTARQWLTVLQASHLVTLLAPHHRSFGQRLVKTPKLYFFDSGLLCYLLRIASAGEAGSRARAR